MFISVVRSERVAVLVLAQVFAIAGQPWLLPARADDAPPGAVQQDASSATEGPVVVAYNEFLSGDESSEGLVSIRDWERFAETVSEYAGDPAFAAALVVTDDPQVAEAFEALPMTAPVRLALIVYDVETLERWGQTGFTPGFMQEAKTDEYPTIEESAFQMNIAMTLADGTVLRSELRVHKEDGAVTLVAMKRTQTDDPETEPAAAPACGAVSCDAGRYWPLCCSVQLAFCNGLHSLLGPFFGPLLCGNCRACYDRCCECSVNNPCHSCEFCGLSWMLCAFVPGGHC